MRGGSPRIVDFSTHFSGPLGSQLLTQLGADVIKVENPRTGDGNRGMRPRTRDGATSIAHVAMNSGTRSLALDRRSSHWDEVVGACARWADAVIVGSLPEAARQRGLDPERMMAYNPRLVYCAITAYGTSGPWAGFAAHGLNPDAFAGLVPVDDSGSQPVPRAEYISAGTPLAGVSAALGIMAALYRRGETGEGQYVHTSLWGSAIWWNWRHAAAIANSGARWHGYRDLGSRYCMYQTADGRAVLVCPTERKYWTAFCAAFDLPAELADRGDWTASGMYYGSDDEKAPIGVAIGRYSLAEAVEILESCGVPFAPVFSAEEALASEQARSQGVLIPAGTPEQPLYVPRAPVSVNSSPATAVNPDWAGVQPPNLGEHNHEILADLGLPDQIADEPA